MNTSAAVAAVVRSVHWRPSHQRSKEESWESGYHPAGKLAMLRLYALACALELTVGPLTVYESAVEEAA